MIKFNIKLFTISNAAPATQTKDFDCNGVEALGIYMKTNGANTSVPTLTVLASPNDRTDLFEVPFDQTMKTGAAPAINQRAMAGAAISASAEYYFGALKWVPAEKMRASLTWITANLTADVWVMGFLSSQGGRY